MHDQTSYPNPAASTHDSTDTRHRLRTAAAGVFAERGYNDASVEEVCSETGIDAATFAEHYSDKYELFKDVVFAPSRAMLRATDGVETGDPRQARSVITRIVDSTADVAIATRATGGFYRSEHRYLSREDGKELSHLIADLRSRVSQPLRLLRPQLSEEDADMLTAAALSTIVSITIHATSLPAPKVKTLLTVTAMRLLDSEPATGDIREGTPATTPAWHSDTSETGLLLGAAVDLSFERGYRGLTMEEVAETAGVDIARANAHYSSLSDLLTKGCIIGFEALDHDMQQAIESSTSARDTLLGLCRAYVRHYMVEYKLMTIYLADARNFEGANRKVMLELQSHSVTMWTRAIQNARPELSQTEATYLVFAALSLVSDLARIVRWNNDPATTNKIEKCASMVMALIR